MLTMKTGLPSFLQFVRNFLVNQRENTHWVFPAKAVVPSTYILYLVYVAQYQFMFPGTSYILATVRRYVPIPFWRHRSACVPVILRRIEYHCPKPPNPRPQALNPRP